QLARGRTPVARGGRMLPRPRGPLLALAVASPGAVAVVIGCGRRPVEEPPPEPAAPPAPGYFEDVTAGSGNNFTHRHGEEAGVATVPEALGGGGGRSDHGGEGPAGQRLSGGGEFVTAAHETLPSDRS